LAAAAIFAASLHAESLVPERRLRMYHTHTGETLDVIYKHGDQYVSGALEQLNHFLRDHRTGDVHVYDPRVFDVLTDLLAAIAHPEAQINIICGYRTPWSNQFLRTHTSGVAEHSLHMEAEAIDIRLPGVSTLALRNAALKLGRGGVGYYPKSGFIHVDVGRVRRW
jgi:uncharacterized protein YcbK (DUF882 family)